MHGLYFEMRDWSLAQSLGYSTALEQTWPGSDLKMLEMLDDACLKLGACSCVRYEMDTKEPEHVGYVQDAKHSYNKMSAEVAVLSFLLLPSLDLGK
jgi:hypothetical protein